MQTAMNSKDETLAYALLRITLGLNMTMHGVSRLIAGPAHFANGMVAQFSHTPLPPWSVHAFALAVPPVEGLLGLLLLIGLKTRTVLVAGSLWIMVLTFGSSLVQDWQIVGVQLIYTMAYAALLLLHRFDGWSVDRYMGRSK